MSNSSKSLSSQDEESPLVDDPTEHKYSLERDTLSSEEDIATQQKKMNVKSNTKCEINCFPNLLTKWKITIVGASWGFFTSIERAIIMPTMWLYLIKYWDEETAKKYYGISLAAFGLSVLVMTPVFGYIGHKNISVKLILLFANQLEIVGNIIYLVAPFPQLVLLGRLIAGIGASIEPPLYAELIATTLQNERTFVIIIFLIARQVGLVFGPSSTLLLHKLNITVGRVSISVYNGPGLVMAVLWTLHSILIIFVYPSKNEVRKSKEMFEEKEINKLKVLEINPNIVAQVDKMTEQKPSCWHRLPCRHLKCCSSFYMRYSSITMYIIIFASYFSSMALETVISPIALQYFQWMEVEVSIGYLIASVIILSVSVLLNLLSKYWKDRELITLGLILLSSTYLWLMVSAIILSYVKRTVRIAIVLIGLTLHVVGLPFPLALTESLYTKLIPVKESHRAQSILRTLINVAYLLGPFVTGFLIMYPAYVFLIMFILTAIPIGMMLSKFDNFLPKCDTEDDTAYVS